MGETVVLCGRCGTRNRLKESSADQLPVCGRCREPLPWLAVATDATFAGQIAAGIPVLVDFWAEWCGPCRMVSPILEELAGEFAGRIKIVKLNVDENPAVARQFNVMSIPTLILFQNGLPVDTVVGALPKADLIRRLQPHLQ